MRNRGFALLALVFVFVATAHAGTITSRSPSTINVGSAEYFITLTGTDLGSSVVFDGPAGTFTVNINSSTSSSVTSWIPIPVVLKTGTYTVVSRGARSGDSNAVTLTIVNPNKPKLTLALSDAIIAIAKARFTGVKYEVGAIGGEDPEPKVSCEPASGSLFPVGKTLVRCVATNSAGERDEGDLTVTLYDPTPPVLKLPEGIIADATQFEGTEVKYEASAFDEIDGELGVQCNPASGSFFRVGVTKVSCTAADFSSNVTPGSFTVEVQGKGLRINVPDTITAEPDGPTGAVVTYVATAAGTSDPRPRVTCSPKSGSRFPLGLTTVFCTATDAFGERAEGKFDVNVKDTVG
ncbi:MAG TPA: HYR domain-containing protein, partial [Thermoanaerobaculia bacterium]|nr:HYR domain-containing protein [Thermoanaerobaculia bacterium]